MAVTLEELLVPKTVDEIVTLLLSYLNAEKVDPNDPSSAPAFAVTDWESGGVERTNVEMEARALAFLVANAVSEVAAGSLITKAVNKWLELRAKDSYDIDKQFASAARIQVTLTESVGGGPYNRNAGELYFETESGLRFYNEGAVVIPTNDSVDVVLKAEQTGKAYNVATGAISRQVTPIPGVSLEHKTLDFSAVTGARVGDGTCTPSALGTLVSKSYEVRITSNGNVGAGAIEWFIDGVSAGIATPIPATQALDAYVQVAFANGAIAPSFVRDDIFKFTTLASPIVEAGRDDESDASLRRRSRARWPQLGLISNADKYEALARAASVAVTKVAPFPDELVAGKVIVVVAGQTTITAGEIQDIQDYIRLRDGVSDLVEVQDADPADINVSGTVVVPAIREAEVKAAAQLIWDAYLDDEVDLGGLVRLSELKQAIMDAGAVDINGLALTATNEPAIIGGPNVNYRLGPNQVARSTSLASQLTWVVV